MITDRQGNLPLDLSVFLGRDALLDSTTKLLRGDRLVTLTGAGGVGKSRLALGIGARLRAAAKSWSGLDATWVIDLGALGPQSECGAEQLYAHMAVALGMRSHGPAGLKVFKEYLGSRQVLLILDTCDRLVPQTRAVVASLLQAVPNLRILATSRQRLGVEGERVVLVPPLSLDDSVSLFLQLSEAAGAGPDVIAGRQVVEKLCDRLDGLPLAIKLAAGRAPTLTIEELITRLDDRFSLLTDTSPHSSGRHSALEHVVDLSFELCTPQEQALWEQTSVFSSFTLDAAENVAGHAGLDQAATVDAITGLINKSVLTRATDARYTSSSHTLPARFAMLDTLRDYGLRRLDAAGGTPEARDRHRDYFQRFTAQAATTWFGPDELKVMAGVRRELPEIIGAIDHSLTAGDYAEARQLCRDLVRSRAPFFWGFLDIVAELLRRVLDAPDPTAGTDAGAADIAATAATAAWVAATQGRPDDASTLLADAEVLLYKHEIGAIAPLLFAKGGSAALLTGAREPVGLLAAARDCFAGPGSRGDRQMATMMWAIASAFADEPEAAGAAARHYLAQAEQAGAPFDTTWALWASALAAMHRGDLLDATSLINRCLAEQQDMNDQWGQTWSIELCAWIIAARLVETDDPETEAKRAAWLLGAALARQAKLGVQLARMRPLAQHRAQAHARIVEVLGTSSTADECSAGARGQASAVRVALGVPVSRRVSASGDDGLTAREREIAHLAASGLSAKKIGQQLFITTRTAETHLRRIYNKTGVSNRAELANWAAENQR